MDRELVSKVVVTVHALLHAFPFSDIREMVDLYSTMQYAPIQNHALIGSRLVLENVGTKIKSAEVEF